MLVAWTALVSCSSKEIPSFETYQTCFDDQPDGDLPTDRIVTCCLDVTVGGQRYACGTTVADCINFLTANLNQTSADTVQVREACEQYVGLRPPAPQ